MPTPAFKLASGGLTRYALACGYVEHTSYDESNRVTLSAEGACYHVRGMAAGLAFWRSYDANSLVKARADYNRTRSHLKAIAELVLAARARRWQGGKAEGRVV